LPEVSSFGKAIRIASKTAWFEGDKDLPRVMNPCERQGQRDARSLIAQVCLANVVKFVFNNLKMISFRDRLATFIPASMRLGFNALIIFISVYLGNRSSGSSLSAS